MNIHHLRAICAVANHGMKLATAAEALHKSQSGISREVREVEQELGVKLFRRRKNKFESLTDAGRDIIRIAERVLRDLDSMRQVTADYSSRDTGDLTVATTHTQARYALPGVVERFMKEFPKVHLILRQGTPAQCCELVASGEADIAISTESRVRVDEVICIPAYRVSRCVVARKGHPILRKPKITLQALAEYPLIRFDSAYSSWSVINEAFTGAGVKPRVLMSAVDTDVSKTYVERGLGIAILSQVALDPATDRKLAMRDANHLFGPSYLNISIRRNAYLRGYTMSFLSGYAPHLSHRLFHAAVAGEDVDFARLKRLAIPQTAAAAP